MRSAFIKTEHASKVSRMFQAKFFNTLNVLVLISKVLIVLAQLNVLAESVKLKLGYVY